MIRKAKNYDIKAIYTLLLERACSGKVLKRSMKEIERVINSFIVFEEENVVIGCCSLEIYSKKLAEIRSLVVSHKYRNKGIGKALVKQCISEAKKKHIYQVLSVTDQCEFFKKYGFRSEVNEKQAMLLHLNLKGGTSI